MFENEILYWGGYARSPHFESVWGDFLHFSLLEVVCTPPLSEKNVRAPPPRPSCKQEEKHAILLYYHIL